MIKWVGRGEDTQQLDELVGGNGRPAEVLFSDGTWLEAAVGS